MSNVFGSCLDKHATWEVIDGQVTFSSNVEGQDPVTLCLDPIKGATLNGEPVAIEEGILILEDMFGSGIVSADGSTYTITLPGEEPVDICLNPVKTVTGTNVDNADPQNPVVSGSTTDTSGAPDTNVITTGDGEVTPVCLNPVKSVSGAGVDNTDPQNPVINGLSTTVAAPDGFHTITTDDGVATAVCLTPLKSINGITGDINGNVNVADLFSNTVDNGDGTYTTTNSDSSTVTWSGDTFASQMDNGDGTVTFTMADGSTVTLCLNPVKSVVQNPDGLGATVTYADSTVAQLAYPTSTATQDAAAGTTTTIHPDGTTHTSCDAPVKDVLDSEGNSVVTDQVAQLPASSVSSFTSNGDGTTTHDAGDGSAPTTNIQEDIVDGGSNLVATDGVTINPILDWDGTPIDVTASKILDYSGKDISQLGRKIVFAGYDATGCKPIAPTECPELPAVTVDPTNCYLWCWDGAAWSDPIPFPDSEVLSAGSTGTIVVDDAGIQAGSGWVTVYSAKVTWVNESCVPVFAISNNFGAWRYRGQAGQRIEVRTVDCTGGTDNMTVGGNPGGSLDSSRMNAGLVDVTALNYRNQWKKVQPGETLCSDVCYDIRRLNYTPDPANRIDLTQPLTRIFLWRCAK